ncbi:MAG TPA: HK97 gp10 family phage protein [Candidatus Tetragenococcus pullicola]|nr:HK97 gp10 family phage protein [Candidatus Tetragenococcus pullicola]
MHKALKEYLEDYLEDIEEDVQVSTDTVIKEAKEELVQTSPRSGLARNTKYYKGWAIKNGGRTRKGRYYSKVIWNKTNYQLTHLLENGHHTRDGTGWVEAQPHIGKVQEKYGAEFSDLLKQKIKRRSK